MTKPRSKKSKVLIVDDHALIREGLKRFLDMEDDLSVCGEAEEGQQALQLIAERKPDVAIVDLGLSGMSGLDLIKNIKKKFPRLPILVLSMHDESIYVERTLRAGARGYIMKRGGSTEVLKALRRVIDGKVYVSESMTEKMLGKVARANTPSSSSIESLSDREFEVFQLLGKGFRVSAIAERLHVSVKTVEFYRDQVKKKLKMSTTATLRQYAVQWMTQNKINL